MSGAGRRRAVFAGVALAASGVAAVPLGAGVAHAEAGRTIGGFEGAGAIYSLETTRLGHLLVGTDGAGVFTVHPELADPRPEPMHQLDMVQGVSMTPSGGVWAVTGGSVPQADTGQGIYYLGWGQPPELVANLYEVEATLNPDGEALFDSNPVAIEQLGDGRAVVADAGANAIWLADRSGHVEVVATLPPSTVSTANLKALAGCPASGATFCAFPDTAVAQSVPTSIAIGPDGAYYVGELTGMPAPAGESRIWRIEPGASGVQCGTSPDCTLVFDGGFTSIMDLELGPDGSLYVAEFDVGSWAAVEIFGAASTGRISSCDLATRQCTVVADDIAEITDITFDGDGALWAVHDALGEDAGLVQVSGGSTHPPAEPGDVTLVVDVPELPSEAGPLLLSVPSGAAIELAPAAGEGTLTAQGSIDGIRVEDRRAANPGWNLSAQLGGPSGGSELERSEGPADHGVDASMFGLTSTVTSTSAGQSVTVGPRVEPGDTSAGVPTLHAGTSVAAAPAGQGAGTAVVGVALDVAVPADVEPGTYAGALTLTVI